MDMLSWLQRGRVEADNRKKLIIWVFISEERMARQAEDAILGMLFEEMQLKRMIRYLLSWEVFFVCSETVVSAYVSGYGDGRSGIDGTLPYNDWYSIPDAENTIPYDSMQYMLRHVDGPPMYRTGPIKDGTPASVPRKNHEGQWRYP